MKKFISNAFWPIFAVVLVLATVAALNPLIAPPDMPMDRRHRLFRECVRQTSPNNLTECAIFVDKLIPAGETE